MPATASLLDMSVFSSFLVDVPGGETHVAAQSKKSLPLLPPFSFPGGPAAFGKYLLYLRVFLTRRQIKKEKVLEGGFE